MAISVSPLLFSSARTESADTFFQPRVSDKAAHASRDPSALKPNSDAADSVGASSHSHALSTSQQISVQNAFSLDIQTRDGDTISVRFSQAAEQSHSYHEASVEQRGNNGQQLSALAFSEQNSDSFAAQLGIKIEGELDADEAKALDDLLGAVQSLSEQFFSGDLSGALEQAQGLGFDNEQLAGLSLDITQRTQIQTSQTFASSGAQAYQQVQSQLPEVLDALQAPLANYVDQYLDVLEQASPLAEAEKTLNQLAEKLLPQESRLPLWQAFNQSIDQALAEQNQSADLS